MESPVETTYELRSCTSYCESSPHVREEADPCCALSATDVTDEGARRGGSRAELVSGVLSSSTPFHCIVDTGILEALHTGEAG